MDSATVIRVCREYKDLVDEYYKNDGKKMHIMIDKVLFKLKFNIDKSDFYSLGNEVFLDALCRYDEKRDFNGFLYSCLMNKFRTEMTRRNRQKRQADRDSISIDTPVGNGNGNCILGDMIADKRTIEGEFFEEREGSYSKEMCRYLSRLSNLQKEVLRLISMGFTPNEIREELHINQEIYKDCCNAIHSYKNISVLF